MKFLKKLFKKKKSTKTKTLLVLAENFDEYEHYYYDLHSCYYYHPDPRFTQYEAIEYVNSQAQVHNYSSKTADVIDLPNFKKHPQCNEIVSAICDRHITSISSFFQTEKKN